MAGKHVVVVGGGNVAMDSARCALSIGGADKVYGIYKRPRKRCQPTEKKSKMPRRKE
jgi:NADPH-dependent glutamate synthase beta subunit-like oxidoreductase